MCFPIICLSLFRIVIVNKTQNTFSSLGISFFYFCTVRSLKKYHFYPSLAKNWRGSDVSIKSVFFLTLISLVSQRTISFNAEKFSIYQIVINVIESVIPCIYFLHNERQFYFMSISLENFEEQFRPVWGNDTTDSFKVN